MNLKINFWEVFRKSVAAGAAICLGAAAYLSCSNKVVGAVLFCIGLYCICAFSLNLFTGKIGYVLENRNLPTCLLIWLGNLAGCFLAALPLRLARPALAEAAAQVTGAKLQLSLVQVFVLAMFCGVLVYIAVEIYRTQEGSFGKALGILLGIPAFILCGFEHSIADMCYFIMGVRTMSEAGRAVLFLLVCSVANGIGSIVFRLLCKSKSNKEK